MEKYVTNIKELVIQTLTNGSEIKAKAESGDALSCFQMGMIYLLGIDTKIDFKKASNFFQNQSLSEDPDANRILGFIAECEGNYSQAFKNYANASKANIPYLNKVYKERVNLNGFFKKIDLSGSAQNKIITNVLNEYIKGGDAKVDASIRIALICDDEETCLVAAKDLFDAGDYYSAMSWLQNGNISENNTLYISVKKKIADSKNAQSLPNTLEVIDIDGNSFLATLDAPPSYAGIKNLCDEQAVACKKEWSGIVSPKIASVEKGIKEEEAARIKKQQEEEAARIKEEEAARIKKQQEEEAARIKQEEEAARIRKQQEEETARIKREEEAARIRKQQEEEAARRKEEEAARMKKEEAERQVFLEKQGIRRKKVYRAYNIIYPILNSPTLIGLLTYLFTDKTTGVMLRIIIFAISFLLFFYLPYLIIKWILKKIFKL